MELQFDPSGTLYTSDSYQCRYGTVFASELLPRAWVELKDAGLRAPPSNSTKENTRTVTARANMVWRLASLRNEIANVSRAPRTVF